MICSGPAVAQDVLELGVIRTESDALENAADELLTTHYDIGTETAGAAKSAGDVLRREASVRVADSGGRLQEQTVSLRGSGAQNVIVAYRGIVLNSLSHSSADLAMLPARQASGIHILPNAGAIRYGSGATGGVIDIVPNRVGDGSEASVSVGSLDDFALWGFHAQTNDSVSASFSVFADRTSGRFRFIDAQGTERTREHNGAYRFGSEAAVVADVHPYMIESFVLYSQLWREAAGISEFPASFEQAESMSRTALAAIRLDREPVELGRADATFGVDLHHRFSQESYVNPTAFLGGQAIDTDYFENRTTLKAHGEFLYHADHSTSVDAGYEFQHVGTSALIRLETVRARHRRHLFFVSAEQQSRITAARLELAGGVRADMTDEGQPAWTARAAVSWQPLTWLEIHASVSHAQRYPSFDEMYISTEFVRGDPNLDSEASILPNAGMRLVLGSDFMAEVEGFYNFHRDLIRFLQVSATQFRATNLSDAVSRGVDVRMQYNWKKYIDLSCSYTFTDSYIQNGHLPIPGIARYRIAGSAIGRWRDFELQIDASYNYKTATKLSGQYLRSNPFRLDGMLTYRWNNMLVFSLEMNNMLNDKSSEDIRQYPLPGLTVMGNVEVKL